MIELLKRRLYRLRARPLPESGPLCPVSLLEDDPTVHRVLQTAPVLERILRENIIPFWMERAIDEQSGGYLLHHDAAGRWKGPAEKHSVPQSRMIWFFSRAYRGGYLPEGLSAAQHGVRFLGERLWDQEHGGFFWAVSHDGASVTDDSKRMYAQCFALYGLAEFARASGDPKAGRQAQDAADVIESRFRDRRHGGFLSELTRAMISPGPMGPRGGAALHKTVNDHVHILEALGAFARLRQGAWVETRLRELILILTGSALRKTSGVNSDRHRIDWTPLLGRGQAGVSYGHDVETVWLVAQACAQLGVPFPLVADWARSLLDFTLRWGRDRKSGGVYFAGPLWGPAHDRRRVWWVQAEVLVGALAAYRLTGDSRYAGLYLDTLRWIQDRHVDWEGGDWHATVEADGRVSGDKAGVWKSAYHNGRAMIQCLELLAPGDPFADEASPSGG